MNLEKEKLETGTKIKETDQQIQKQKIQAEERRTTEQLNVAKIAAKQKEKNNKAKK